MSIADEIYAWLYPDWTPEDRAAIDAAVEQARTGVVLTDDQIAELQPEVDK